MTWQHYAILALCLYMAWILLKDLMQTKADILADTRRCAYALDSIAKQTALGTLALKFSGDDHNQWLKRNGNTYNAIHNDHIVATCTINNHMVDVEIENIQDFIRPNHRSDFIPEEHGFEPCYQYTVFGEKLRPDLSANIDTSGAQGLNLPKMYIPKQARARKPRVIPSL